MTDRVGRSSDSVGRTSDSVRHSMWRWPNLGFRRTLNVADGGGRAAAQAGGAGSLPLSRCATAPPRGERLDRVVRGATPGWQALAPRSARSVRRWLPRVGACRRRRGRAVRRPRLAGLGASPSVAARQLPLGGSDWIGLFGGRLQAGRLWLLDRRAPFGGGSPEWELPQAEAVRRPRLARLGASPSVAARQLPLGGSDWIGLFGRAPFGGGSPEWELPQAEGRPRLARLGASPSGCATAPPRGERLDRVVRGDCRLADFGSRIVALRSAVAALIGSSPPLPPACAGAGCGSSPWFAGEA